MDDIKPKDVVYLEDAMKSVSAKIAEIGFIVRKNTLPGARGKIMQPLQMLNTQIQHIDDVLKRSGMDKKLGFVQTANGVQPVMDSPKTEAAPEPAV